MITDAHMQHVLGNFLGVEGDDPQWMVLCPVHDDHNPSLSIRRDPDRILVHCFAGCDTADILAGAGLDMRDLFGTLTVSELAADKQLYEQELKSWGCRDSAGGVVVPYYRLPNQVARERLRTDLSAGKGSRWLGARGTKYPAYGVWRLSYFQHHDRLVLVEGESDCWTLWHHGYAALGIPGASNTKVLEASDVASFQRIYMVREPDAAGAQFVKALEARLKRIGYTGELLIISMPASVKDPNALHQQDAASFRMAFDALLHTATPCATPATAGAAPAPFAQAPATPSPPVDIIDKAQPRLHRPLMLVDGHGYAASWVHLSNGSSTSVLVVVRDDAALYCDVPFRSAEPLRQLGAEVSLREKPLDSRLWSGAGVRQFLDRYRPDPADVFARVQQVIDGFLDFSKSLAPQADMVALLACYVLATYGLDAFNVIGYVWANGERGAAKTRLLIVLTELAYLGTLLLATSSHAALRELADYGACLGFDDAETLMDFKRADPDKRTLFLAGNRRGTSVALRESVGKNRWVTRYVDAYCPRLFSAINLPDEVLGSRAITIPLVRSTDARTDTDPLDHEHWPCDRRALIDDLWAVGLLNVKDWQDYDRRAAQTCKLKGRTLEPWRAILAVALWLEERHGQAKLFERMEKLAVAYQRERGNFEVSDRTRVLILALGKMFGACPTDTHVFATSELTTEMNAIAKAMDLAGAEKDFTSPQRTGRLLGRLRVTKADRTALHKRWQVSKADIRDLAVTYAMDDEVVVLDGSTGTAGTIGTSGSVSGPMPSCRLCHLCQQGQAGSAQAGGPATGTVSM